jgi:hypothetical protein
MKTELSCPYPLLSVFICDEKHYFFFFARPPILKDKAVGLGDGLKKRLIQDIEALSETKVKEVMDFVDYLRLKEDEWYIAYVNKRTEAAKIARRQGKRTLTRQASYEVGISKTVVQYFHC